MVDILVSPFIIRLRTNSTTSSLLNEFQMPSHARIMNSSSGVMVARLTSGRAEIICSSGFRSLFYKSEKSNGGCKSLIKSLLSAGSVCIYHFVCMVANGSR